MKILTPAILGIPLFLSIILDSYGLEPPLCHPKKKIWKETQDLAVCTDDNQPTEKPIIRRNGVDVSGKSTIFNRKYQVSYQPLRADEGQVLECYVSDQNCTFGTLNVVYKPEVTLTRMSKNIFSCTVDANPFLSIGWSITPSYLIHHTEQDLITSTNSMLTITKPSQMMNNTNITCFSQNDIGKDSVTLPYIETLPSTEIDINDNTSYRTSTSNSLPSTKILTENHGHTPTPWKVGKSGNIYRKSIPVYVMVLIVGGTLCLLILIMFGCYIYKRPYRDDNVDNKNTADNSNTDPIYVELNNVSGQRDSALDTYNDEISPVNTNYYEHLPDVVSNKMQPGHNSDSLKKHTSAIDSECENHVESSVQKLDNLPKKCPVDAPAYFVLEENYVDNCTIYEDINDKYEQVENSSGDYDCGGQEESVISKTLDDYNIYAEIGTGDTTKDFVSHENEIYESLDTGHYDKFHTIRPLPEFSKSILSTNRSDSKTCQIASAPEQRTYTDECNIKFLLK
ncbi:uncharacterized protein LOC117108829 [Anneissia japonica]|uniref:uncharacterized protein LOC117108829 n=1 Tax=Anneissia japonica TaxID=1529436 RepID=UPI001425A0D1|nr:uncharacterized protein LOC117108829 [Anneissia japonica]XP_033106873.1 uncharacterized protein LOC117108829 [Anneissia japonica]XP_033106874.1 uncharacterized protein LOC117108829 [Anneissia japonica]